MLKKAIIQPIIKWLSVQHAFTNVYLIKSLIMFILKFITFSPFRVMNIP